MCDPKWWLRYWHFCTSGILTAYLACTQPATQSSSLRFFQRHNDTAECCVANEAVLIRRACHIWHTRAFHFIYFYITKIRISQHRGMATESRLKRFYFFSHFFHIKWIEVSNKRLIIERCASQEAKEKNTAVQNVDDFSAKFPNNEFAQFDFDCWCMVFNFLQCWRHGKHTCSTADARSFVLDRSVFHWFLLKLNLPVCVPFYALVNAATWSEIEEKIISFRHFSCVDDVSSAHPNVMVRFDIGIFIVFVLFVILDFHRLWISISCLSTDCISSTHILKLNWGNLLTHSIDGNRLIH